jgi:hypothetical protein
VPEFEIYQPTLPPIEASPELRNWLREELDRIALTLDAVARDVQKDFDAPRMYLGGDATDIPVNTTPSVISGYTLDGFLGKVPTPPDPATGEITVPERGLYKITAYAYFFQPVNTKDDTIQLIFDINDGALQAVVGTFDITSNKTTERSIAGSATRILDAGDVVKLLLLATDDLGTVEVQTCALEVTLVPDVDPAQFAALNL